MDFKDTFFYRKETLNCRGRLVSLSRPLVMGILNVTPDSFFDGGKYKSVREAVQHGLEMKSDGADIIDIGGCSTRPGSEYPGVAEELKRVIPVISALMNSDPELIISIDTYNHDVALRAVEAGASIINDISAATIFPEIADVAAGLKVPYVVMHMQGTPQTMQENPVYSDVTTEVLDFLISKTEEFKSRGITDLIVDPGFGFGKTLEHNYRLLAGLESFKILNYPLLAGFSRKMMVNRLLSVPPENALTGTTVLNTLALEKGASILRVHDVKEAAMAVKIHTFTRKMASGV